MNQGLRMTPELWITIVLITGCWALLLQLLPMLKEDNYHPSVVWLVPALGLFVLSFLFSLGIPPLGKLLPKKEHFANAFTFFLLVAGIFCLLLSVGFLLWVVFKKQFIGPFGLAVGLCVFLPGSCYLLSRWRKVREFIYGNIHDPIIKARQQNNIKTGPTNGSTVTS